MVATSSRAEKISVILPAFNEEKEIVATVMDVEKTLIENAFTDYEILVVDDGCLDATSLRVENAFRNDPRVKLIRYDRNRGKGYAVKRGFEQAAGDIITFIDADGELPAKQIPRYVNLLQRADCVIASRSHPQSVVDIPLGRRVFGKLFNALVQMLTGLRCGDTQCGLKALKKQVIQKVSPDLLVKGFAFDVELLTLANLYGFKIAEAPVKVHSRQALFSLRAVFRIFMELLGITYRLRVKKWYQKQIFK